MSSERFTNLVYDNTVGSKRIKLPSTGSIITKVEWDDRAGPIKTVTAAYTLTDSDGTVLGDASGGAFAINLPAAISVPNKEYTIIRANSGANAVTPTRSVSDTIGNAGATTYALTAQDKFVELKSDGVSKWLIIGAN